MTIRYDGTYISNPIPWEEWHAGAHMHGSSVHFWRFYPDSTYANCSREIDHGMDFYAFTEALTADELAAATRGRGGQAKCGQRLVQVGKYNPIPNGIHCTFGPDDISGMTFDWDLHFTDLGLKWLIPDSGSVDLQFKPSA